MRRHTRHLLGIFAITSAIYFSKEVLLARPWMVGANPTQCEVDLYLVGGGGPGGIVPSGVAIGGYPGGVTIVRGIPLSEIPEGCTVEVGAGAAAQFGGAPAAGGDTRFDRYKAFGGRSAFGSTPFHFFPTISDVPLGHPLHNAFTGGVFKGRPSYGPGVGGSVLGGGSSAADGGDSNANDTQLMLAGASPGSPAGANAPAESLQYGSGGAGVTQSQTNPAFGSALRGGFPGGGGGGRVNAAGTNPSQTGGPGGNGVIRLAVFEWRSV